MIVKKVEHKAILNMDKLSTFIVDKPRLKPVNDVNKVIFIHTITWSIVNKKSDGNECSLIKV